MSEPRYDLVPRELLDPVVRHFRPQRIILFGSHARGDAREDSDIDLLVVVDDDTPAFMFKADSVLAARREYFGAVDIIVVRARTFADRVPIIGALCNIVAQEGVDIFRRSGLKAA